MNRAPSAAYALQELVACAVPEHGGSARTVGAHGPNVYVGTTDGHVLWWRREDATWCLAGQVRVSRHGKPVEKVLVMPEVDALGVLCEHVVHFYTLPALHAHARHAPIKGVVQAVLDDAALTDSAHAGIVSLCILKRQTMWLVMVERDAWAVLKEIPIPRDAFIAQRYNDVVCLATSTEYALVNIETGACTPLGLPISQSTMVGSAKNRPSIVPVPAHGDEHPSFVITSHSDHGTLGAFLRADGEPTARLVEWPSHPRAVVAAFPYLVALLRDNSVHVHDLRTLERVQALRVSEEVEARFLVRVRESDAWLERREGVPSEPVLPSNDWPVGPFDAARWEPVSILLGGKVGLYALAQHTAGSQAMLEIDTPAERQVLEAPRSDEVVAAMQMLGVHHLAQARFPLAGAYLAASAFPPEMLLTLWPGVHGGSMLPICQAAAGLWARLPATIDDVIRAHLAWNYVPELGEEDEAVQVLHKQLRKRADDMLWDVLLASGVPGVSTALLQLALARDPSVPLAQVDAWLPACDASARALAEACHRYVLAVRLCEAAGALGDAVRLACRVYDGEVQDAVDTMPLDEILRMGERLAPTGMMQLWLWLVRHDIQGTTLPWDEIPREEAHDVWCALLATPTAAAFACIERIVLTCRHVTPAMKDAFTEALVRRAGDDDARIKCGLWLEYGAAPASEDVALAPMEQAVVLARRKEYAAALRVLVEAHAFEAADTLCEYGRVYPLREARALVAEARFALYTHILPSQSPATTLASETRVRLRHALWRMYIHRTDAVYHAPALALLRAHPAQFDIVRVLSDIPATWPVRDMRPFLEHTLRAEVHARRRATAAKALAHKTSLDAAHTHWRVTRSMGGVVQEK